MKRNVAKLKDTTYDLVIIGGGITGAWAALDSALRGLKIALVDKGDFGAATSSASGKIIHGGIRYLQYGDIKRMRESLHERMVFQKVAPHLVHPIPFLIPTYGHLIEGKEILKTAMILYDLLSLDKRKTGDSSKKIPLHRTLSRKEVLKSEPSINPKGLTGGILYYDCQMHNPERLTLSILRAAEEVGADLANYTMVRSFKHIDKKITGLNVKDLLDDDEFSIDAEVVLNAAGPWSYAILDTLPQKNNRARVRYTKGIHIITPAITRKYAIAITSRQPPSSSIMQRGGRHYFIIPWRNHSLIGTTNTEFKDGPDARIVTEEDIQMLLQTINSSYQTKGLKREDVKYQYGGLYIDDSENNFDRGYQGSRRSQIHDHENTDEWRGLITAISVKYTTARKIAQNSINLVYKKLGYKSPDCKTEITKVYGGNIENFQKFVIEETQKKLSNLNGNIIRNLIYNYGNRYYDVLRCTDGRSYLLKTINKTLPIIRAQVIYAVRKEMAVKLEDVVFRRTALGTLGNPGENAIRICAKLMAAELSWDEKKTEEEINKVLNVYLTE